MGIRDWPEAERPRERLLKQGAHSLSDAELLALFLRVGMRGKSAVDLARDLLTHFGGLSRLCHADLAAFSVFPGLGPAKFAQLKAVMELARRALLEEPKTRDVMQSPSAVRDWLRLKFGGLGHEVFCVLTLNAQNCLIEATELFRGTLTQTSVYPREVLKLVLAYDAARVILVHNHPSGHPEPSPADIALTDTLKTALALVDVPVLDHLVVTASTVFSMAEAGLV